MTESFILERTSQPLNGQLALNNTGNAGQLTISSRTAQTFTGDIVTRQTTGDRFFLLDHDLSGLYWKGRPHYAAGAARINAALTVSRIPDNLKDSFGHPSCIPEIVAADLPAFLEVTATSLSRYRILLSASANIRRNDWLTAAPKNKELALRVFALDRSTWDNNLLIVHALAGG